MTTRRTFLAHAPALALAAPVPVLAAGAKIGVADLLAEYRAAIAEFDADDGVPDDRYQAAARALYAARPTDPEELAAQARFLADELEEQSRGYGHVGYEAEGTDLDLLRHFADALEAMARRPLP